jgi:hypothetical protein
MVLHNYMNLTDAVRTGGRTAAISRTMANPTAAAQSAVVSAAGGLSTSDLNVQVSSTWQLGADVTVTATYPYTISIFGIAVQTGSLTSSTTQRLE